MHVVTVDDAAFALQYARWWLGQQHALGGRAPAASLGVRGGHGGGARARPRPAPSATIPEKGDAAPRTRRPRRSTPAPRSRRAGRRVRKRRYCQKVLHAAEERSERARSGDSPERRAQRRPPEDASPPSRYDAASATRAPESRRGASRRPRRRGGPTSAPSQTGQRVRVCRTLNPKKCLNDERCFGAIAFSSAAEAAYCKHCEVFFVPRFLRTLS